MITTEEEIIIAKAEELHEITQEITNIMKDNEPFFAIMAINKFLSERMNDQCTEMRKRMVQISQNRKSKKKE